MKRVILSLALLSGCAELEVLHLRIYDARKVEQSEEIPDVAETACEFLDLECDQTLEKKRYALRITLVDVDNNYTDGQAYQHPCHTVIWIDADSPRGLAHEIGHALGLEHHPDKENLMYFENYEDSVELTLEQQNHIERRVKRLRLGCP